MTRARGARRVAIVTGTRAEYGILKTVIDALTRRRGLALQVIATGMHLLPRFGRTLDHIRADGVPVAATVRMQRGDDTPLDQAEGLGRGVTGLARALARLESEIVLVLGDRIEALAGALAGATCGVTVAHLHGGDVAPGHLDDTIRHALTKVAHVHLAATRAAARRVRRLGEDPDQIHVVGAPGLDELRAVLAARPSRRRARSGQALVIQHASGRPAQVEQAAMRRALDAVLAARLRATVICPNSDAGHSGVFAAIDAAVRRDRNGRIEVIASMPRRAFLEALCAADVLVGNSSAGIVEAPYAGTPVVNVGQRQAGRERGGRCVFDADEQQTSIQAALERALRSRPRPGVHGPYGDGRAADRIADILATLPRRLGQLPKRITY